jgi:hypothetical protein
VALDPRWVGLDTLDPRLPATGLSARGCSGIATGVGWKHHDVRSAAMSDDNGYRKYKEQADADVESVEAGDSPSDVESKVLGLTHVSGAPSVNAKQGEESAATIDGS